VSIGGVLLAGGDHGVFRSVDTVRHWTRVDSSLEPVCFATVRKYVFAGAGYAGIYRSSDSGVTWSRASNGVTAVVIHNLTPMGSNLFAGTETQGVLRSTDYGDVAKGGKTTLPQNSETDDCQARFLRAHYLSQGGQYRQAYDSARQYLITCPNTFHSYDGFSIATPSLQFESNDNMRWLDYRVWLKSVLYLDTLQPDQWYCSDAQGILATFQYRGATGQDYNGAIATIDFILKGNRCPADSFSLLSDRHGLRQDQFTNWSDTVKHPELTPLDTIEPNIDDLGLSILRGPQAGVSILPLRLKTNILSFGATESPFRNETELYFELSQPAALKIDLLDVLGREVGQPSVGELFAAGKHYAKIGGELPNGTIYARLTMANGEVRTLKLIKLQ
jgi:hypothetical protein